MIVEFTGLPGAGKTEQREALIEYLDDRGLDVVPVEELPPTQCWSPVPLILGPRTSLLISKALSAVRHRDVVAVAARQLRESSRTRREKLSAMRFVLTSLDRHRRARLHAREQACIVDEGVVQRAFMVMVDRHEVADAEVVADYFDSAPLPDVVVHIEIDASTSLERLAGRERGLPERFEALDTDELHERLDEARSVFEAALTDPEPGAPVVVRVDGDACRDEIAARIGREFTRLSA